MFATSGILFNHESPLKGKEFVTRKITDAVAKIHMGKQKELELGNMDTNRDWGFAKEYVDGIYRMLQIDKPGAFVFFTNKTQTVRDFVSLAFKAINVDIIWKEKNENEIGLDDKTGITLIKVNPKFYRPSEVDLLIGDASKAYEKLN